MEKLKNTITRLLIGFALISTGYIFGKHSAEKSTVITGQKAGDYVQVYYMHGTKRCRTCNTIETMTKEAVDSYYSELQKSGELKLTSVNFQNESALAKQFGVAANCVVVAKIHNGSVESYERLDNIWSTMKSKVVYDSYICSGINKLLDAAHRVLPVAPVMNDSNLVGTKPLGSPWEITTPLYKEIQK